MYVEINDPQHCTIIAQPAGAQLHPDQEHARTCPQCQQNTWVSTSRCMWCGFDVWHRPLRLAGIAAAAVIGVGTILTLLATHLRG